MGDSSLGVAGLTAATAIVASLAATWSARSQARTEARTRRAEATNQRRRESYRAMTRCVSGFSKVLWRMAQVDQEADDAIRRGLVDSIRSDARTALDDVEEATRGVEIDGPEEVSKAASELCFRAVLTHHALSALTDGRDPLRAEYDQAYRGYRRCEDRFLRLARATLGER
ncbi:hypothetical protein ACWGI9_05865 [Streptomyces sp. NPDC054833]